MVNVPTTLLKNRARGGVLGTPGGYPRLTPPHSGISLSERKRKTGGAKVADCFQAGQGHEAGNHLGGSDPILLSLFCSCSCSCPGVAKVWPIATAAERRREL